MPEPRDYECPHCGGRHEFKTLDRLIKGLDCDKRPKQTPERVDLPGVLAEQIRAAKLPAPEREIRFHPTRRWQFDLAWPSLKLAVEVDGATFAQGRHTRGSGYARDCTKCNTAGIMGWLVLRVTTQMLNSGEALQAVQDAVEARSR